MKLRGGKIILSVTSPDEDELRQLIEDNPKVKVTNNLITGAVNLEFEKIVFEELKKYPKLYQQFQEG